jgi:prophage tail gpP-like protein
MQYQKYDLFQIAKAICGPFNIGVDRQTDVTDVGGTFETLKHFETDQWAFGLAGATAVHEETCFAYLERLGRLQGVLLTDDQFGRLVLTNAGMSATNTALVQGQNILTADGDFDFSRVFSEYRVVIQNPPLAYQGGQALNDQQGNAVWAEVFAT